MAQQLVCEFLCTSDPERAAINDPKTGKYLQSKEPESESPRISMLLTGNTRDTMQHNSKYPTGESMAVGVN
jgi:hypothetical protein